ncbi:MAG: Fic family protein [Defluviitaleaceae bacterium]|nr:Fic family protein [Defluviitaleaceae bacterium]MCL2240499.1 Fic family protein [Defluviitaleaceae bacterium]
MLDPYLYEDCAVLKNKLGIKDEDMLSLAEVEFSCNAINDLLTNPISGDYDFAHLCRFHARIFGDVYDWAGQPRTVPIEKAEAILGHMTIEYAPPQKIDSVATEVLKRLNAMKWQKLSPEAQGKALSTGLADLWKVHPFREGNTRTTVTFICQFAESKGLPLDRVLFEQNAAYVRSALVAASAIFRDGDFRKPEYLIRIVTDALERGSSKET